VALWGREKGRGVAKGERDEIREKEGGKEKGGGGVAKGERELPRGR
jgi:hypothetical protein